MCSIEEGFKLCTCGEEKELATEKIIWELRRVNPEKPQRVIRGKIAARNFSEKEQNEIKFIESELNTRNCFDFDYIPQENDYLIVIIDNKQKYTYSFKKEWKYQRSPKFFKWKSQLEDYKKGKVK
ncbi:MAG: hypothetical protein GY827_01180 [Cytophagales bacterium]|nr:hypothetical protein [Cytophagales bacterium]